jgi:hypothetical protein
MTQERIAPNGEKMLCARDAHEGRSIISTTRISTPIDRSNTHLQVLAVKLHADIGHVDALGWHTAAGNNTSQLAVNTKPSHCQHCVLFDRLLPDRQRVVRVRVAAMRSANLQPRRTAHC